MTIHQTRTAPSRRVPPAAHQPGPVTLAIRALRPNAILSRDVFDAQHEDERRALRELRERIAGRIEADLALLDALDGDPDFEVDAGEMPEGDWRGRDPDLEPSLCGARDCQCGPGGDDREHDDAEHSGIGDEDGLAEQFGFSRFSYGGAA